MHHINTEKQKKVNFTDSVKFLHITKNHCLHQIVPLSAVISDRSLLAFTWHRWTVILFLIKLKLDEITLGAKGQSWKKNIINVWSRDPLSDSVQDFFDAPAAEQEIQAFLHRLDEAVGKVATQEVLASSQTHSHVPEMLSQSRGGHGLWKRTLRMHDSTRKVRSDLACAAAEVYSEVCSRCPAASYYL